MARCNQGPVVAPPLPSEWVGHAPRTSPAAWGSRSANAGSRRASRSVSWPFVPASRSRRSADSSGAPAWRSRLLTWAAVGAAAGLEIAAFFEQAPGADLPRDIEHLRRQNLIVALSVWGGWTGMPEAALPGDGPRPRSIDVLLERTARREVAVVEIWDLLLDGGAAMRGLEAKVLATRARQGQGWHVEGLIVVRGTRRNRALVHELGPLFAARYPASSAAWLGALVDPQVPLPQAGGFAWTDVAGSRLLAARFRCPRPARGDGRSGT